MNGGIHPAPTEFTAEEIATDPLLRFFHYSHLLEAKDCAVRASLPL